TSGLTTRRATTTGLSPSVWTTSATPSRSSAGCAGSGAGRGRGRKPRREMKSPAGAGLFSCFRILPVLQKCAGNRRNCGPSDAHRHAVVVLHRQPVGGIESTERNREREHLS